MDLSVMPKSFSGQHHWYLATLASVSEVADSSTARAGEATLTASSKLLYSYTHVVNGFSASLTPSELEALKKSPGYISSIKDLPVKLTQLIHPNILALHLSPQHGRRRIMVTVSLLGWWTQVPGQKARVTVTMECLKFQRHGKENVRVALNSTP